MDFPDGGRLSRDRLVAAPAQTRVGLGVQVLRAVGECVPLGAGVVVLGRERGEAGDL